MSTDRTKLSVMFGCCVVVNGASFGQVPALIDLWFLTADRGIVIQGEDPRTQLCRRVVAGDIDGDGQPDLIISAPFSSPSFSATVYVVFGGSAALRSGFVDLSTLGPPDGFVMRSPGGLAGFGSSTTAGVDVNLDGIDDMVITGPCHSPDSVRCKGQAFVVYGHHDIGAGGSFDVRALDGTNGFVVNGRGLNDFLGENFGPVPVFDYNGDGHPDIVLVSQDADAPGRPGIGQIYVIFGRPGLGAGGSVEIADLIPSNSVTINGLFAGSGIGRLGDVGDFNGDGVGDILWGGALGPPDRPGAGSTYVLFGGTPADANGVIESSTLPGNGGLVMYGERAYYYEYLPEPVGDVNGDGIVDHMVNAGSGGLGRVVVGGPHLNQIDVIDLGQLDGTNGFSAGPCCRHYKAAGDLDDDGFADLVRQDSYATVDGRIEAGRANVAFSFKGMGDSGSFTFPLSPDGCNGFEVWGVEEYDNLTPRGWIPDINGDGLPELVFNTVRADLTMLDRGYILFGQRRFALGDFDRDRDVDMADFMDFVTCYNGPVRPPAGSCPEGVRADFDADGDVDTADYGLFAQRFTGAK